MNPQNLKEISLPVQDELKEFQSIFRKAMKSDVQLVDIIARYILKQKGKKIRPMLVLLSAMAGGGINERSYRGAVLVELLHTATLVHDDVVDNSSKRRGFPSINAVWKNKAAVLMGDYLLSRGLLTAVEGKDYDFLEIVTNTVKRMSEGELLQIKKTRKLDIDEETYYRIISDKTASLIETCCRIGAVSTTTDEAKHIAMGEYGKNLGIAFQIRDDILDYEGSSKLFGKPIGGDIKEKKITLPLIYSLNSVDNAKARKIRKLISGDGSNDKIKEVIEFVREQGGIEFADKAAHTFAEKAKQELSVFQESDAKQSLVSLVEYVVSRKK